MSFYTWLGPGLHRRYVPIFTSGGRGRDKIERIGRIDLIEIKPGEVFEPTAQELHSFRDKMQLVGSSLRVMDAARAAEGEDAPPED